jgi:hypothetical protein
MKNTTQQVQETHTFVWVGGVGGDSKELLQFRTKGILNIELKPPKQADILLDVASCVGLRIMIAADDGSLQKSVTLNEKNEDHLERIREHQTEI